MSFIFRSEILFKNFIVNKFLIFAKSEHEFLYFTFVSVRLVQFEYLKGSGSGELRFTPARASYFPVASAVRKQQFGSVELSTSVCFV